MNIDDDDEIGVFLNLYSMIGIGKYPLDGVNERLCQYNKEFPLQRERAYKEIKSSILRIIKLGEPGGTVKNYLSQTTSRIQNRTKQLDELASVFFKSLAEKTQKTGYRSWTLYEVYFHNCINFKELLIADIENLQKEFLGSTKHSNPTGYYTDFDDEQISQLYRALVGIYFHKDTKEEHFKAIFRPDPLPRRFHIIRRKKGFTKISLAFLIVDLFQENNPDDLWKIAKNCFHDAPKSQDYSGPINQHDDLNYKPRGYPEIVSILTELNMLNQ